MWPNRNVPCITRKRRGLTPPAGGGVACAPGGLQLPACPARRPASVGAGPGERRSSAGGRGQQVRAGGAGLAACAVSRAVRACGAARREARGAGLRSAGWARAPCPGLAALLRPRGRTAPFGSRAALCPPAPPVRSAFVRGCAPGAAPCCRERPLLGSELPRGVGETRSCGFAELGSLLQAVGKQRRRKRARRGPSQQQPSFRRRGRFHLPGAGCGCALRGGSAGC